VEDSTASAAVCQVAAVSVVLHKVSLEGSPFNDKMERRITTHPLTKMADLGPKGLIRTQCLQALIFRTLIFSGLGKLGWGSCSQGSFSLLISS
jgi:hypothetical protein